MRKITKTKTILLAATISQLVLSYSVYASNVYDVEEFDVNGITVGMTREEVLQVLTSQYPITADDFTYKTESGPSTPKVVMRMSYRSRDLSITVQLRPNIEAKETGYTTVRDITIRDSRLTFEDALAEKIAMFGPPSVALKYYKQKDKWTYRWCSEILESEAECGDKSDVYTFSYAQGAYLKLGAAKSFAITLKARGMMQELGIPNW